MAWSRLTHQFYSQWEPLGLRGQRLLLLMSGGTDSLALFFQFCELATPLGFAFEVLHVHHGGDAASARDEALEFCRNQASRALVKLHLQRSARALDSELEMRQFRKEAALRLREEQKFDRLVTAHQADDLLETRLFRIFRGTGAQGLASMREWHEPWWKPLLQTSRAELRDDLLWRGVSAFEDPTNQDLKYRRNWIRQSLLPQMEAEMPGSVAHFSRFLSQVVEDAVVGFPQVHEWVQAGIPRSWFLQQTASEQRRALASYLFELGVKNYAHTQIEEVRKQLDNPKIVHTLTTAGCDWFLNQDAIYAVPQGKP